jgi:hypothetical protein
MTKSEIAQAFSHGDFEKCFAYLIDQTTWDTPGEQMLKGRDEIESLCQNVKAYFYSVTTNFQQINVIESANCVAMVQRNLYVMLNAYLSCTHVMSMYLMQIIVSQASPLIVSQINLQQTNFIIKKI